jgi:hypothetical protein
MFNTFVGAGTGAGAASRYDSGSDQDAAPFGSVSGSATLDLAKSSGTKSLSLQNTRNNVISHNSS